MKTCIVCQAQKPSKLFASNNRDRCQHCHDGIVHANKIEKERVKKARIEAYATGEMPKAKPRKAYYNNGTRRKIENIIEDRKLAKEWE